MPPSVEPRVYTVLSVGVFDSGRLLNEAYPVINAATTTKTPPATPAWTVAFWYHFCAKSRISSVTEGAPNAELRSNIENGCLFKLLVRTVCGGTNRCSSTPHSHRRRRGEQVILQFLYSYGFYKIFDKCQVCFYTYLTV